MKVYIQRGAGVSKLRQLLSAVLLLIIISVPSKAVDIGEMAKFGAGFASAVYVHELGHAVAVWLEGGEVTEIRFAYTGFLIPPSSNRTKEEARSKLRNISIGGYIAQTLLAEAIIQNKSLHNNGFMLGMMSMGLYANISNPIRYYVFGERDFDLGSYAASGGDPLIPSILMVSYSLYTLSRIVNNTDIDPYLSKNVLGFSFKF